MHIKDRILQAARLLFTHNGPKSVSMDEIATHLGVSKKTLYKWFRHKNELVYEVLREYLRETTCTLSAPHQHPDALAEFAALSGPQHDFIHSSIFFDLQKYYPESWALWLEFKNGYLLSRIKNNLIRGQQEGLYQPDADVGVLARLRLVELELAFDAAVFPASCFPVQRVQAACLRHFLAGIVTTSGQLLLETISLQCFEPLPTYYQS